MKIKDLVALVGKGKRKKESEKIMKKIVIGLGVVTVIGIATGILFATKFGKKVRSGMKNKAINAVESINDTIQNTADAIKDSSENAVIDVSNAINSVHKKSEGVNKDIQDGFRITLADIHKTAENVSNELNKPVK